MTFEQAVEQILDKRHEKAIPWHQSPNNEWHTDQHNGQGGNIDRGSSANQITESAKSKRTSSGVLTDGVSQQTDLKVASDQHSSARCIERHLLHTAEDFSDMRATSMSIRVDG